MVRLINSGQLASMDQQFESPNKKQKLCVSSTRTRDQISSGTLYYFLTVHFIVIRIIESMVPVLFSNVNW
jgi:hypothetical protein